MRYAVVIERGHASWSAYVPDLPGCAAVGAGTEEEARALIRQAMDAHVAALRADGQGVPEPRTLVDYVEAAVR
jgi:predicted RNase H-like HicB family nuclease